MDIYYIIIPRPIYITLQNILMQKHKELNDKGECTNKPQLSLKK